MSKKPGKLRAITNIIFLLLYGLFLMGCNENTFTEQKASEEPNMFLKPASKNYVIFSPMEGVLMQNGKPLANTSITRRLRWNGNDEGLVEEFVTDEQGQFSLPIHEETLALGMLNQFVGKADLEIETENGKDYLWTSSKFFPEIYSETGGQISELICDIESEEIAVPMGPSSILTKCRWTNMPE